MPSHEMTSATVGLVLSGGGAKGAYQVGVLKALNELNVHVDILAGASIGALNGAIIAAASSQQDAALHLEDLWLALAKTPPLSMKSPNIKLPAYLIMLGAFGLTSSMIGAVGRGLASWGILTEAEGNELLCNKPIQKLIDRYLGDEGLTNRVPLHVSVYPTQGLDIDIMRIFSAALSMGDTAQSEFLHIQSLAAADQKKVLLATAALPLLYEPQEVNGNLYSDGGQGGWRDLQGNTPIAPLLKAGCRQIIVTHLSDGSLWDRTQFPDASIIEIRPKISSIKRKGAVSDLLGFDNTKIPSWIQQGYDDTHACIAPIVKTLNIFSGLKKSEVVRDEALRNAGVDVLRDAMFRLKG